MPNSFCDKVETSHPVRPTCLAWHTFQVDWPCEKVAVEAEVVAPRDLDILEWAAAQIIDQFAGNVPTLQEATDALGLHTQVFLADAIRQLIQIGAIQQQGCADEVELQNCSLTPLGKTLLREGQVQGLPEHHGILLYFDAITGDHLKALPKSTRKLPESPVIEQNKLPARIASIGLDRVRALARDQGEPHQKGESQISGVRVRVEEGEHVWTPVRCTLFIDGSGRIEARVQDTPGARQAWFDKQGLQPDFLAGLKCASTAAWANGRCQNREAPVLFQEWAGRFEQLITPASTVAEATALIENAQEEVVLHSGWLDAPELPGALSAAAGRGVRCYLCGAQASITEWTEVPGKTPGFIAAAGNPALMRPLAMVVDRAQALRIDRVMAKAPSGEEIEIEVASLLRSAEVNSVFARLVEGLTADLAGEETSALWAAFALSEDAAFWKAGVATIERQGIGSEQIRALRLWGEWGRCFADRVESEIAWEEPALQLWQHALQSVVTEQDRWAELLDSAVALISPAEALNRFGQLLTPAPAHEDPIPLGMLVIWAGQVRRRWQDAPSPHTCPPFAVVAGACLDSSDSDNCRQAVQSLQGWLERQPSFSTHAASWFETLSSLLPVPSSPTDLLDWLEWHVPLARHLGERFRFRAVHHLGRIGISTSAADNGTRSVLGQLREAWKRFGLPDQVLAETRNTSRNTAGAVPATAGTR